MYVNTSETQCVHFSAWEKHVTSMALLFEMGKNLKAKRDERHFKFCNTEQVVSWCIRLTHSGGFIFDGGGKLKFSF